MSIGIGYWAAFTTLLSWTVGTFAFTHASRQNNPSSVNRVRLLYAFVILSLLVMAYHGLSPVQLFSNLSLKQYFWFGISGFIGLTLGDYFSFTAYSILGGRRTSLFICVAPGAALLAAWLLIDEQVSLIGVVGMTISIAGILLLVLSRKEQNNVAIEGQGSYFKGILFAALGAICQGIGLVMAKKGFSISDANFNPMYATWVRMFIASVFVYVIGAFKINLWREFKSITFNKTKIKPVLLGTIFGPVIGVSFSLLAASHLEASVAQTIFSLLPVSVLFASIIFFKEKVGLRSYLAVLISISGVVILVWRNQITFSF